MSELELMLPVIAALVGVLVGGGGATLLLARVNRSVALKDSTERLLAEALPPETLAWIYQIAVLVKDGAAFTAAVTDGQSNPRRQDE